MTQLATDRNFVIASLPRCGSTTLARILSCHSEIRCLVEPFHPKRYGGRFHSAVSNEETLESVLRVLWSKWTGIKHVWEANGWPFPQQPQLNESIVNGQNRKAIVLVRRNLLRRFVSNYISRQTRFWIGSKSDFLKNLKSVDLPPIDLQRAAEQLDRDRSAVARHLQRITNKDVRVLYYEELFSGRSEPESQLNICNSLLEFLQFEQISLQSFLADWHPHFDPEKNQWASADIYRRIPNIDEVEELVGSDENGWLFR